MPVATRYVVYLSIAVGLVVLATYFLVSTTQGSGEMAHNVFKAPGWWPTSNPNALRAEIERYIKRADAAKFEGKVAGLILPHAGYQYSGTVAACGCKLLKQGDYDRAIVLGLSHGVPFRGISILEDVTHYSTPLGEIEVDRTICDQLLKEPPFTSVPRAHAREHSLANQLPFLQVQLGEFKLVPMLVSDVTPADCDRAAGELREHVDNRTLVVASSDFTHYGADYRYLPFRENVEENLKVYADQASEAIISLDFDAFRKHLEKTKDTICGRNPLSILIKLLAGYPKGTVVARDFSGRMEGSFARSVTYISIAIPMKEHVSASRGEEVSMKEDDMHTSGEEAPAPSPGETPTEENDVLSHAEQQTLLKLARDTLEGYFKNKIPKGPAEDEFTDTLKRKLGVFVTLTSKVFAGRRVCRVAHGKIRMRSCIGSVPRCLARKASSRKIRDRLR